MSIDGQGHFFTIYIFQVLYVLCFSRSRYQVSVYRTIGPLVSHVFKMECEFKKMECELKDFKHDSQCGLTSKLRPSCP